MNDEWQHQHRQRMLVDEYLEHGGMAFPDRMHEEFADEDDLIRALHQRWVTLVNGCLETELETSDDEPVDALRRAWATAAGHAPALRRALDSRPGNDLLTELTERHLIRLAAAIGSMRPGHSVREGLEEVRAAIAQAVVRVPAQAGWLEKHRRTREVRRMVMTSMRGY